MRADTLIQEQCRRPVFITPESKELKLGSFKKTKKQIIFTTICKHEAEYDNKKIKIWQKKRKEKIIT